MKNISKARRVLAALLIVFAGAAVACADSALAPVREVAGCYAVTRTPWLGDASEVGPLPDSIRLYDVPGTNGLEDGRNILRAHPDSSRMNFRWAWWQVAAPDTLILIFSTGFTGARAYLRPEGADYVGRMASFVDYSSDSAVAMVRLAPIACTP